MDGGASSCRGSIVLGGSYSWANFTVLALGVWAVAQRDSIDAISMVSWEWTAGWAAARERGQGELSSPHFLHSRFLSSGSLVWQPVSLLAWVPGKGGV